MKKIFLLLILLSNTIYSQTKIDKFVSIQFPGKVVKLDTIVKGLRVENFISQTGNETFIVQKTILDSIGNDLNSLPSDLKSLKKTYRGSIQGYSNSLKAMNLQIADSSQFMIDKFLCYNVVSKNENNKNAESNFLVLNEYLYIISYFNLVDFNEKSKSNFLTSIKIDSKLNPSQTIGNPTSYKIGYIFGKIFFFLVLIGIAIYFVKKKKKK